MINTVLLAWKLIRAEPLRQSPEYNDVAGSNLERADENPRRSKQVLDGHVFSYVTEILYLFFLGMGFISFLTLKLKEIFV